jgi:putative FmdB family regulatory protein
VPTYDYQCDSCSHIFEKFHGINATPKFTCPVCGSSQTQRRISGGIGLSFKGDGFYITDYKNGRQKSSDSKAGDTSEKSAPKSDKATKGAKE